MRNFLRRKSKDKINLEDFIYCQLCGTPLTERAQVKNGRYDALTGDYHYTQRKYKACPHANLQYYSLDFNIITTHTAIYLGSEDAVRGRVE